MNPDRVALDDIDSSDDVQVDDDGFEIDPALAASMGFTTFGTAPKKRKYTHDNAIVDVGSLAPSSSTAVEDEAAKKAASGGNAMPLGKRNQMGNHYQASKSEDGQGQTQTANLLPLRPEMDHSQHQGQSNFHQSPLLAEPQPSLQDFRNGVMMPNGDVAYFMPSFIEDPWAKLTQM